MHAFRRRREGFTKSFFRHSSVHALKNHVACVRLIFPVKKLHFFFHSNRTVLNDDFSDFFFTTTCRYELRLRPSLHFYAPLSFSFLLRAREGSFASCTPSFLPSLLMKYPAFFLTASRASACLACVGLRWLDVHGLPACAGVLAWPCQLEKNVVLISFRLSFLTLLLLHRP